MVACWVGLSVGSSLCVLRRMEPRAPRESGEAERSGESQDSGCRAQATDQWPGRSDWMNVSITGFVRVRYGAATMRPSREGEQGQDSGTYRRYDVGTSGSTGWTRWLQKDNMQMLNATRTLLTNLIIRSGDRIPPRRWREKFALECTTLKPHKILPYTNNLFLLKAIQVSIKRGLHCFAYNNKYTYIIILIHLFLIYWLHKNIARHLLFA